MGSIIFFYYNHVNGFFPHRSEELFDMLNILHMDAAFAGYISWISRSELEIIHHKLVAYLVGFGRLNHSKDK